MALFQETVVKDKWLFARMVVFLVAPLALLGEAAMGQEGIERRAAGVLAGQVVDAESALPLGGTVVVLDPVATGVLPDRGDGESSFLRGTHSVVTDSGGEYRFAELASGSYRLRFQRVGYRPVTLEVELGSASGSRVSVGLTIEPVALEPVSVSATAANAYDAAATAEVSGNGRVSVERLRQARFLPGDVRAITRADVVEGITLAETDLYRALQRLPGVSAGDEYSAELWTRGAPWDQTRVFFDGLPLFNPVHGLGLFGGVNPDAVGAAFLHPGVQPVSLGGGGAGVLDLRSRSGSADKPISGTAEVSLASSRIALDGGSADGSRRWMVAGRRTYLDWLTGIAEWILTRDHTYQFPYDFYDLTARYDQQLGESSALELSGFFARDNVGNDNPNVLSGSGAHFGGGATRATLQTRLGGIQARHTLGFSGWNSAAEKWAADWTFEGWLLGEEAPQSDNSIRHLSLGGELIPSGEASGRRKWSVGYQLVREDVQFTGPAPVPFTPLTPSRYLLERDNQLVYGSLWGERRWMPSDVLAIDAGIRLDAGPAVEGGGALRLSPRGALRYQLTPDLAISAAAGRSFQYLQALAPTGPTPTEGFRTEHFWLLAGDSVPAIRSDVATVSAESWIGERWLTSVTVFGRKARGIVLPDPVPGPVLDRPLFVTGENIARGVELSARRLRGRWTASAGYTYGVSETRAAGLSFPSAADQRHALDVTALVRVGKRWQLGAAYTAASGTPYTRTFRGTVTCPLEASCEWRTEPWTGSPNGRQAQPYQSLDLLADWTKRYKSWSLSFYLQLRNALNHPNPGRYLGYGGEYCVEGCEFRGTFRIGEGGEIIWIPPPDNYRTERRDEFVRGLPVIPLIGIRVTF